MRKTILFVLLALTIASAFTSCATAYGTSRNGCKMSQGYVGYR